MCFHKVSFDLNVHVQTDAAKQTGSVFGVSGDSHGGSSVQSGLKSPLQA